MLNKPLAGLRVLDLTHMLSGPYAGMILADLGAETIKVGKRQLRSRRFTFRSAKGELDGNIWIGDDGRLLQVSFPQTQIRVVLAE